MQPMEGSYAKAILVGDVPEWNDSFDHGNDGRFLPYTPDWVDGHRGHRLSHTDSTRAKEAAPLIGCRFS